MTIISQDIERCVRWALEEDIGSGDITAALIPADQKGLAGVISRDDATICGRAWVDEVFRQLDPDVEVAWRVDEGQQVTANTELFRLSGSARSLLTGERCALNFLQTLSGTATLCQSYADLVATTEVRLLDTRKTLPGLRTAQKYAVTQGGCHNHRIGLFDAFLIKENHINACGGIRQAIERARQYTPGKPVEVEVESIDELEQALRARADIVMLDNFSIEQLKQAVALNRSSQAPAKLEASGGITRNSLLAIAQTGVDYISIGALTKDCRAIDLSMRFQEM
ncbi:carboxylating nicotinate-nucleotide diphosphorylase [Aestuariirhabdus sp. Z084]|uniref:carboxylating nicotinate-nucleotide diphosphorylase n=1 Tax=Aestuariirhabdus haliotis TaxID=2918751 RepID=UPI00201B3BB2|nr:carboxylating nicotinate-nucleotide diphosphorylase [Aestuariirhabdus haliotis]MCL6415985.1 carboxylating nicotinate-nucleotide diphosphorylase [Aestuariirhabdus haliotis]MCL6419982.1 carboxylating nicotinate-nucleotide diphosphorylase [Aestuariirhabdus haliotis]